jgi:hypothetical protein
VVAFAVLAILTLAGVVVARAVRGQRQREAAQELLLIRSGFRPCDGDAAHLATVVRSLRKSTEFEVRSPWKWDGGDAAIHWYEAVTEDAESRNRLACDEFLCTLRRPTQAPLLLYLSPAKLEKGLGTRLIEKLLVVTAPPGFHKLDHSASAHASEILAAFGPQGASWGDLVDPDQLALFARGARHGVFVIRCSGEHCALELLGAQARKMMQPIGWPDTWSFVRQVAGASSRTTADRPASTRNPAGAAPSAPIAAPRDVSSRSS